MKKITLFFVILLSSNIVFAQTEANDVKEAIKVLDNYKKAIEKLDTTGTGALFIGKSQVVESGKIEGRYQDYIANHLGPELKDFKSFSFTNYTVNLEIDGKYAFATESYDYTIVLKDDKTIAKKGIATSILIKENGIWKIMSTHSSSRNRKI